MSKIFVTKGTNKEKKFLTFVSLMSQIFSTKILFPFSVLGYTALTIFPLRAGNFASRLPSKRLRRRIAEYKNEM